MSMVTKRRYRTWTLALLSVIVVIRMIGITLVHAKDGSAVQELSGPMYGPEGGALIFFGIAPEPGGPGDSRGA